MWAPSCLTGYYGSHLEIFTVSFKVLQSVMKGNQTPYLFLLKGLSKPENEWVNKNINPFQTSIATSHLICIAIQMTGFYMKCDTEMD